jgi:hypothetical protein
MWAVGESLWAVGESLWAVGESHFVVGVQGREGVHRQPANSSESPEKRKYHLFPNALGGIKQVRLQTPKALRSRFCTNVVTTSNNSLRLFST